MMSEPELNLWNPAQGDLRIEVTMGLPRENQEFECKERLFPGSIWGSSGLASQLCGKAKTWENRFL